MTPLIVQSPIDGRQLGVYYSSDRAQIDLQMQRSRAAVQDWSQTSVKERAQLAGTLRKTILARLDEIVDALVAVTGKVRTEALLGEIYPVMEILGYYEKHARSILAPQSRLTSPFSFPSASACVQRQAFGVVAVISPWNFPFQLTMTPLVSALIAGNSVLVKLSELSLPIAELIISLLAELNLPENLVQIVYGDGAAGEQLIDAAPDLVCFTGSLATGRKVMARAAQHPVPVILELGGKDPMLIFAGANLSRAIRAAAYGAFSNSGQVCVSVERCYVQRAIYRQFVDAVCAELPGITVGSGDLGAITDPRQFAIVEAHYQDALSKGAKASGELRREGNYLYPVALWDVDHTMTVMQQETFGPLLPIMPFEREDEAIQLANDSAYGLNASVWTSDLAKGERIGRRLQTGNFAVNDVIKNIGHPGLPFGGVKGSGFGRQRGPEGLLNFTYPVAELINSGARDNEPNWFPYSDQRYEELKGYLDFVFGADPYHQRARRNLAALQAFREYASLDIKQRWRNFKQFINWRRGY